MQEIIASKFQSWNNENNLSSKINLHVILIKTHCFFFKIYFLKRKLIFRKNSKKIQRSFSNENNNIRIQLIRPNSSIRLFRKPDFSDNLLEFSNKRRNFNIPFRNFKSPHEYNLININNPYYNKTVVSHKASLTQNYEDLRNYMRELTLYKENQPKNIIKTTETPLKTLNSLQKTAKKPFFKEKLCYNTLRTNQQLKFLIKPIENKEKNDNNGHFLCRNLSNAKIEANRKEENEEFIVKKPNFDNFKVSKKYSHVKRNMSKTPKIQNLFNISQTQLMILNRKPERKTIKSPCEAIQDYYKMMLHEKNSKNSFKEFFQVENEEIKIKI